jgi:hypothetical protein
MDSLHTLYSTLQSKLNVIQSFPKKIKLQQLERFLTFVRCFSVKGVQGIAGLLYYRPDMEISNKPLKTPPKKSSKSKLSTSIQPTLQDIPIVFKLNSDINLCIEHERDVLLSLNTIRNWCPHFVGCLGYISIPIANDFIDSEKQQDSDDDDNSFERRTGEVEKEEKIQPGTLRLWDNQEDVSQGSIVFLEYIGSDDASTTYSMHHMCRYGSMQQSLAQMIMTLCALETAQQELQFVHYDMHLDNILMKECDPNLVFVYRYPNPEDMVIVPTLGHYPVLIDMGSSFCQSLVGHSVKTSISFYSSGLQPTVFDPLNDVHHFLFRCIDRLEMFNDRWRDIGTKLMHIFRHLPLWRYKGWKKLPSNLVKRLVKTIYELVPEMAQNEFWTEYTYEIMDLLVISTTIHWRQDDGYRTNQEALHREMESAINLFNKQLIRLDEFKEFESDDDILMTIRLLAELSRHVYVNEQGILELSKEEELKAKEHLGISVGKMPPRFQIADMVKVIYRLGRVFGHLLSIYLHDNMEFIHNAYKQIKMKRPIDAIHLLQQMVPFRYRFTPQTTLRIFDHVQKRTFDISMHDLGLSHISKSELTRSFKSQLKHQIHQYAESH